MWGDVGHRQHTSGRRGSTGDRVFEYALGVDGEHEDDERLPPDESFLAPTEDPRMPNFRQAYGERNGPTKVHYTCTHRGPPAVVAADSVWS